MDEIPRLDYIILFIITMMIILIIGICAIINVFNYTKSTNNLEDQLPPYKRDSIELLPIYTLHDGTHVPVHLLTFSNSL